MQKDVFKKEIFPPAVAKNGPKEAIRNTSPSRRLCSPQLGWGPANSRVQILTSKAIPNFLQMPWKLSAGS